MGVAVRKGGSGVGRNSRSGKNGRGGVERMVGMVGMCGKECGIAIRSGGDGKKGGWPLEKWMEAKSYLMFSRKITFVIGFK